MKTIIISFVFMVLFTFFGYMIGHIFYIASVLVKYGSFSFDKKVYFYEPIVYTWTAMGFFVGIALFIREIVCFKGRKK